MEATQQVIARGQCDATDRLLSADEPLASLQRACGGEMPGVVAIPDLLALVRGVRVQGRPFARMIRAQDERHAISAWIQAVPHEGGCLLTVEGWRTVPLSRESDGVALDQPSLRALAAGAYLRLDSDQNVQAFFVSDPALQELRAVLAGAPGQPWTEFVVVDGYSEPKSLHWRLLDGAVVTPINGEGRWRALLSPQFGPDRAIIGFDLHLVAVADDAPEDCGGLIDLPFDRDIRHVVGTTLAMAVRRPAERIEANVRMVAGQLSGPIPDHYAASARDILETAQRLRRLIDDLGSSGTDFVRVR